MGQSSQSHDDNVHFPAMDIRHAIQCSIVGSWRMLVTRYCTLAYCIV